MEPVSISLLLANIKTAIELTKLITDTDSHLEKAELNLKLADIINSLASAKIEVSNLKDILNEKDSEIKKLKEKVQQKHELKFVDPVYRNELDEPFCTRCFDSDSKSIRLQKVDPVEPGLLNCPECKNQYETEDGAHRRLQRYEAAMNKYIGNY